MTSLPQFGLNLLKTPETSEGGFRVYRFFTDYNTSISSPIHDDTTIFFAVNNKLVMANNVLMSKADICICTGRKQRRNQLIAEFLEEEIGKHS